MPYTAYTLLILAYKAGKASCMERLSGCFQNNSVSWWLWPVIFLRNGGQQFKYIVFLADADIFSISSSSICFSLPGSGIVYRSRLPIRLRSFPDMFFQQADGLGLHFSLCLYRFSDPVLNFFFILIFAGSKTCIFLKKLVEFGSLIKRFVYKQQ